MSPLTIELEVVAGVIDFNALRTQRARRDVGPFVKEHVAVAADLGVAGRLVLKLAHGEDREPSLCVVPSLRRCPGETNVAMAAADHRDGVVDGAAGGVD